MTGETDKKQVYFFFVASHGIDKASQQHIVLNQFNKSDEFYKLVNIEDKIRILSKSFTQSYNIAVFACCRELFKPNIHTACVEAKSIQEATQILKKKAEEAELKEKRGKDMAEENLALKEYIKRLEAQVKGFTENDCQQPGTIEEETKEVG